MKKHYDGGRSSSGPEVILFVLAVASMTFGLVAGGYRIIIDESLVISEQWPVPVGIVIGVLFWSMGCFMRRHRENTNLLRRVLIRFEGSSSDKSGKGTGVSSGSRDSALSEAGLLSQILEKITELNSSLLLTEEDKLRQKEIQRRARVDDLTNQINVAMEEKDYHRARDLHRTLMKEDPDSSQSEFLASRIEQSLGEDLASYVQQQIQCAEDMMSVSRFAEARQVAEMLINEYPESEEAKTLLERVDREADIFGQEKRKRLLSRIRRNGEERHWKLALDAARELVQKYPDSSEAEVVKSSMAMLVDNTRIEEVREFRDRIVDLMDRRRYAEALDLSTYVVNNYPETAAASELRTQMPHLRELASGSQSPGSIN